MIVLPTYGRPENLRRFVKAYKETNATLPISVVFNADNAFCYNDIETPPHWKRISAPVGSRLGDIFKLMFKKYPNDTYYGMVADDVLPETERWDTIMAEACQPDKIVWGMDGIQNARLPVHPFIGGDLLRKLGWWACPGLKHWYVDNVWKCVADALDCGVYMPEVKMTHLHYINGKAALDRTYRSQPDTIVDERVCRQYMETSFVPLMESIKSLSTAKV